MYAPASVAGAVGASSGVNSGDASYRSADDGSHSVTHSHGGTSTIPGRRGHGHPSRLGDDLVAGAVKLGKMHFADDVKVPQITTVLQHFFITMPFMSFSGARCTAAHTRRTPRQSWALSLGSTTSCLRRATPSPQTRKSRRGRRRSSCRYEHCGCLIGVGRAPRASQRLPHRSLCLVYSLFLCFLRSDYPTIPSDGKNPRQSARNAQFRGGSAVRTRIPQGPVRQGQRGQQDLRAPL